MSNASPPAQPDGAEEPPLAPGQRLAPGQPLAPGHVDSLGAARAGRRLLASSATVSIFNGLGVLAGFALDATVAAIFGVGSQTDAFFSAWRLPNLITVVLAMAASAALVPLFARDVAAGDQAGLSEFFSRVFNAGALLMGLLSLLGVALSPWLVGGLFAGLPAESLSLAASLSRILFLTVLFTGVAEVLRAYLYGYQIFAIPTAINFVRSAVAIAVLLAGKILFPRQTASDWAALHWLAWGYVAGVAAQVLVVGWQAVARTPLRWRPLFDLRHPRLRRLARHSAAPTAGAIVRQAITLAETMIASYLPPGSVTVLSYANRLTFVLSSVFLSSITTASMPMLSQAIGAQRRQEVRNTILSALRLVTFLALPMGVALAALGVPIIRLLFERGRFDAEASVLTGAVLSFYALSVLFLGYFRIVQAYFYAALKAGVVLVLFVILAVASIGLDIWLAGRIGVQGIAIGFSAGTVLVTALGLWRLGREVFGGQGEQGEIVAAQKPLRALLLLNGKVAVASASMAGAALVLLRVLPDAAWALLPAVAVGGGVFILAARALRVKELQWVLDLVARRRRRS